MKARQTIMMAFAAMLLVLALWPVGAGARGAATVGQESDSAHFVTASMVVITPGPDIPSVFGHNAIRMECPSKGLDYCFSFEAEGGFLGYLKFFAGQSRAGFVPVPTQEYLAPYQREGRGATQYELNLTPHEKQELWRALDEDMLDGAHRKFTLIQSNCASMSMFMLESILDGEYFDFRKWPQPLTMINGKLLPWLSRRSPWGQFLFMTFLGSEADCYWEQEYRISPSLIIPVLRNTRIRKAAPPLQGGEQASGYGRPALTGASKVLLPMRNAYDQASPLTPNIFFGALLAIAVIYTIAAVVGRRRKMNKAQQDITTPVAAVTQSQTKAASLPFRGGLGWGLYFLVSLFLLYVTLVSGLFGVHWNWLLIPFNPLPAVVWLLWRRRPWYPKVWWAYAAVLAAFVAVVPWLTIQLQPAHYMLVATLAVLCVWRAMTPEATETKKISKKVRKNK